MIAFEWPGLSGNRAPQKPPQPAIIKRPLHFSGSLISKFTRPSRVPLTRQYFGSPSASTHPGGAANTTPAGAVSSEQASGALDIGVSSPAAAFSQHSNATAQNTRGNDLRSRNTWIDKLRNFIGNQGIRWRHFLLLKDGRLSAKVLLCKLVSAPPFADTCSWQRRENNAHYLTHAGGDGLTGKRAHGFQHPRATIVTRGRRHQANLVGTGGAVLLQPPGDRRLGSHQADGRHQFGRHARQ